jgi:hypothetical protein
MAGAMASEGRKADYSVDFVGREREPVVTIDGFSGQVEALERMGREASYRPVPGYPGLRSPMNPAYLAPRSALLREVFRDCFGLTGRAELESCDFSVVSLSPGQLSPGQRIPHYDAPDAGLIALLHFTAGVESGGTAFYRHRRTGFEAILPERVAAYAAGVAEDDRAFGPPPAHYCHGSDERYEMIGEVEARPDRAILYRGRLLHSGHVPVAPVPETARQTGRQTINTFIVGCP